MKNWKKKKKLRLVPEEGREAKNSGEASALDVAESVRSRGQY